MFINAWLENVFININFYSQTEKIFGKAKKGLFFYTNVLDPDWFFIIITFAPKTLQFSLTIHVFGINQTALLWTKEDHLFISK